MMDIIIPHGNEEEFMIIARKLGYSSLLFLYDLDSYAYNKAKLNLNSKKFEVHMGFLSDFKVTRKKDKLFSGKRIFSVVKSSKKDREVIESKKADMIFSFEETSKRDFLHHKASGLNHILCKLARENDVIIGFSINSLLGANNPELILGRLVQNVKLCTKYKVKNVVASFAESPYEMRSVHDIRSLFRALGLERPRFLSEQDLR
jgi:RNase P/RNase MRP subunit p30